MFNMQDSSRVKHLLDICHFSWAIYCFCLCLFENFHLYRWSERCFLEYVEKGNHQHHHHHVQPLAWISLTLSRHFSLSFIASGRSSRLHPVSAHSWCIYVRAIRPAFARPYVGVHRSTSLMNIKPVIGMDDILFIIGISGTVAKDDIFT